jgi:SpoVK/Ycf46/Vps4 family AAA+-type ATPase
LAPTGSANSRLQLAMFLPLPPSGKTHIAKAIANEARMTFFSVSSVQLIGMWMGESEKMVSLLFRMARYYSPSIIFLDEIDALLPKRGGRTEHELTRRIQSVVLSSRLCVVASKSASMCRSPTMPRDRASCLSIRAISCLWATQ